ncbi:MAG TPA: MBL fold metallo-hydrolase, partial [Fimbriimonas sp.]|nr:MBL fold metallo-hydrolase [Fimbriimonas sp.]
MIIRNFFEPKLAQASYLVGCAATGEAIVIDPLRDISQYLAMAEQEGLRITAVTETHIHADFLSGSRELSAATGAKMYLSDEGDDFWKYQFASDPLVVLLKHDDVITVGNLTLRAVHTPGHTPEHLSFLLTDHPASDEPHSMFTGDFIFAGDVGRPDLLERAANFQGTMEAGARVLFGSLQKMSQYADSLLLWPAHGAGSACGKSLGGSPVTSLGYERTANWAFQIDSEDVFVEAVLAGQPEPPFYFKEMKMRNRQGPDVLGKLPSVPFVEATAEGDLIDVRPSAVVRGNYIPGTLVIPSSKVFTNWAGWMLAYDKPVTLVAENQAQADQAARDMATIGLDIVSGWKLPVSSNDCYSTTTCSQLKGTEFVLDVRGVNEYNTVHINNAHHIPLGYLPARLTEVPKDQEVVVHCAGGNRSAIAVSVLKKAGYTNVTEIPGGMNQIQSTCPTILS